MSFSTMTSSSSASARMECGNVGDFQRYYRSFDDQTIQHAFHNLDDADTLETGLSLLQSSTVANYIVDIAEDTAWAAFDLTATSLIKLVCSTRPQGLTARWINIFRPDRSKHLLESLAKRYDFSPRLLAMMCSDPKQPASPSTYAVDSQASNQAHKPNSPLPYDSVTQLERGPDELSQHSWNSSRSSLAYGNIYRMANDLWHYTSVDFGRNYICIGYNSLYGTKPATSADDTEDNILPQVTRVWTWLVICDDSTVISINEDLFPYAQGHWSMTQQRITTEVRRNLYNVFHSLSAATPSPLESQNPMTLLPIRMRLGSTIEETVHREADTPGLLFYYLFENWHNSYMLIARRESRYGVELAKLRADMFRVPQLYHIDRLDKIGKELGVLQRHYQAYDRIIERLLEPQIATAASLDNSRVVSDAASRTSLDTVRPTAVMTERDSMLGVSISSAGRVRFKRLKDLIDLYALSEVQEYLKQKDSLVAMNFNLIAIKESLDVEKLTRITLLITKATFLFLPVSLVIGYFSIELVGIDYTVAQFWIAANVVLVISFTALLVFGLWSGTVQTFAWWKPFRQWLGGLSSGRKKIREQ